MGVGVVEDEMGHRKSSRADGMEGMRAGTKQMGMLARPSATVSIGWNSRLADEGSTRSHRICHNRVRRPLDVSWLPSRFKQFDGNQPSQIFKGCAWTCGTQPRIKAQA